MIRHLDEKRTRTSRQTMSTAMRLHVILLMGFLLLPATVYGQSKTGTTVGQFLLIEPSARVSAMGNAGVTAFDEASAAFYNPAALGHMAQSDVQFTVGRWLADITYNYATAGIRLGAANTLLLSVTSLNSGEISVRTVEQPLGTGERYSVRNTAFGLGFARRFTDRFSAGFEAKYLEESIWHNSMTALSINFGVLYELPFQGYLGASLSNFGTRGKFSGRDLRIRYDQDDERFGDNSNLPGTLETETYPLPILFRVGVGFPVNINASNTAHFTVDAFQPSDNTNSVSFGGEWTFIETFSLRGGYQHLFQEDTETGLTLGMGLNYTIATYLLRVDYAWNDYGRIGDVQRFTLGFSF